MFADIMSWPVLPYPRIEIVPPGEGRIQYFAVSLIGSVEAARARRAMPGSRAVLVDGSPPLDVTHTLEEALLAMNRSGSACDELDLYWIHDPESIRGSEACRRAVYELDRMHAEILAADG